MNKVKANPLSRNQRMKIGKYADNNPNATMVDITKEFKCTYNQVVFSLKLYRAGKLHINKPKNRKKNVEVIITERPPEDIISNQFHRSLAELEADQQINVSDRIIMLDKLISMRKTLQQINLENHIKKTDAGIIANIIRKFKPDAGDDDIIKIYKEAVELWKMA